MKTFAPDYYKDFKCIASACRHNCCIGWEIDIDDDTYEYYRTVKGDMGKRLSENIACDGECRSFRLGEDERCPFLGNDGLCDIIKTLGEDALCQICTDHPRYRNFFSDREEIGIGLSCEEAARLIVRKTDKTVLCKISDDNDDAELYEDESEFFAFRGNIFDILQNRSEPLDARLSKALSLCGASMPILSPSEYAQLFLELEYMEQEWHDCLCNIKTSEVLPELPKEYDTAFEQLAVYFVFRHLSKCLDAQNIAGVLTFCVLSTKMTELLCRYHLSVHGTVSYDDIAEYARMYSCEVEYSEENTQFLCDSFK